MTIPASNPGNPSPRVISLWTWGALLTGLAALVGSLLLSVALNLKACPLCFYQRTFVMGVVGVLGVGLGVRGLRPGLLSFLALAPAIAGFGVAVYHVYLEANRELECPMGLLGAGTAPQQSLAALSLLLLFLAGDVLRNIRELGGTAILAPVILGVVFTVAVANKTTSPGCKPDYSQPLDGCRPPDPAARQS